MCQLTTPAITASSAAHTSLKVRYVSRRLVARTDAAGEAAESGTRRGTDEEKRADSADLDTGQRQREPRRREEGVPPGTVRESRVEPEEAAEGRGKRAPLVRFRSTIREPTELLALDGNCSREITSDLTRPKRQSGQRGSASSPRGVLE